MWFNTHFKNALAGASQTKHFIDTVIVLFEVTTRPSFFNIFSSLMKSAKKIIQWVWFRVTIKTYNNTYIN